MPEQQNIEWKAKWDDKYLEWICGFANAQGGKIYIGCDDDGQVIGVVNSAKLLEDIPNKVRDAMGIIVGVNLIRDNDGVDYLEIDVPAYPIGISCKGIYYYRSGSTKQILSGPALETFLLRKRGATWDNLPLPVFSIDDIYDDAVELFKNRALQKGRVDASMLSESNVTLLNKLHLVNGDYLTNAAMLLFSKDPERWQLGAYIKVGYFSNNADLLYQDEVHGPLLEQVDKVVELIKAKYIRAKIFYHGVQRVERYFVPEEALREAILNAICHKSYQSGIPIQISVYEDKLYIANCGCLPDTWTVENLMNKHASIPYNPSLAHVFYLAGLIESWGRGIEKICSSCKSEGIKLPKYTINPADIMIEFSASEKQIVRMHNSRKVTDNKINKSITGQLSERELQVLALILENPKYTMAQLSQKMNISRKTVASYQKKLKDMKIIERVGSARNGYWKILVDNV